MRRGGGSYYDSLESTVSSGSSSSGGGGSGGGTTYGPNNRLDAAHVGDGSVSNAEFAHLNGVTSNISADLASLETNLFARPDLVACTNYWGDNGAVAGVGSYQFNLKADSMIGFKGIVRNATSAALTIPAAISNRFLGTDANGALVWSAPVPSLGSNGQFLGIVNGAMAWVANLTSWNSLLGVPNTNSGSSGDVLTLDSNNALTWSQSGSTTFTGLTDTPSTLGNHNEYLQNSNGAMSWGPLYVYWNQIGDAPQRSLGNPGDVLTLDSNNALTWSSATGGGGSTTFVGLSDTPSTLGQTGHVLTVNTQNQIAWEPFTWSGILDVPAISSGAVGQFLTIAAATPANILSWGSITYQTLASTMTSTPSAGDMLVLDSSLNMIWTPQPTSGGGSGNTKVYTHLNIANDITTPSNANFHAISSWSLASSGLTSNSGSVHSSYFIAPRAGVYAVQVEFYFKNTSPGVFNSNHKITEAFGRIMKNGVKIHDHGNGNTGTGTYVSIAMQVVTELSLGDTISAEYLLVRSNNSTVIKIRTTGTHLSVWSVD